MIVVVLVITTDGTKVPVALMLADTESAVVVKTYWPIWLPADRAIATASSPCWTGSKALRKAVANVFGERP